MADPKKDPKNVVTEFLASNEAFLTASDEFIETLEDYLQNVKAARAAVALVATMNVPRMALPQSDFARSIAQRAVERATSL